MARITVQAIARKAKQIRHKGEKWTNAIKRAAKMLKHRSGGTVGAARVVKLRRSASKSVPHKRKAAAKKKSAKNYKPRKPTHQTGSSSKKRDEMVKALPPGKRRSAGGSIYYEYRKNRTDMPGRMTGISARVDGTAYREMIMRHMRDADRARSTAEQEILRLKQMKRVTSPKEKLKRRLLDQRIKEQQRFVSSQKKEISMLKTLYK